MKTGDSNLVALTATIVSAHVTHNQVAVSDLPGLIAGVYASLAGLDTAPTLPEPEPQVPAVSVRASIRPDYLVCLEDGKRFKVLKRHLMTDHQLTPTEYRAKWNLPADYPMVAADYATARRGMALSIGLGRKGQGAADAVAAAPTPVETAPETEAAAAAPATRTRKPRLKISVGKG